MGGGGGQQSAPPLKFDQLWFFFPPFFVCVCKKTHILQSCENNMSNKQVTTNNKRCENNMLEYTHLLYNTTEICRISCDQIDHKYSYKTFCIRMLKNRAQITLESIETPMRASRALKRALDRCRKGLRIYRARNVRSRIIFCAPPPPKWKSWICPWWEIVFYTMHVLRQSLSLCGQHSKACDCPCLVDLVLATENHSLIMC